MVPTEKTFTQEPTSDEKEGQSRKGDRSGASADFAALIDVIRDEGKANRDEERREDRGKAFREKLTVFLLCLTVIAIGWQVYEMIHVYGPIRDQAVAAAAQAAASDKAANAAIRAADSTTKAADAAVKQSEIATKQAESSDRAAIQSQRAWVGPRDAKLESKPAAGQKNKFVIEYQNTGREPGLGFVFNAVPGVETLVEDSDGTFIRRMLEYLQNCAKTQAIITAGVVYPTTGLGAAALNVPIDEKLIDADVVSGNKVLIINGCLTYQSGNIVRHSAFCYFYKSDVTDIAHLNICAAGNYAD
jgi:hypothetical protein